MDYAYEFVVKNNGIDTEEDYPYKGGEKSCNKNKVINLNSPPIFCGFFFSFSLFFHFYKNILLLY